MQFEMKYEGICLKNRREKNMDSLLVTKRMLGNETILLGVVCDGVGSRREGEFASSRAVALLSEWLSRVDTTAGIGLYLREEVLAVNADIVAAAASEKLETASTLSALLLAGDKYYIVHVGDSRIYFCPRGGGEPVQLTCDDVSPSGKLTACLGHMTNDSLQYGEGPLQNGTFLLCSDGFYRRIDHSLLLTELETTGRKSLKKAAENLTRYVINQGESDNISLAIIKIES